MADTDVVTEGSVHWTLTAPKPNCVMSSKTGNLLAEISRSFEKTSTSMIGHSIILFPGSVGFTNNSTFLRVFPPEDEFRNDLEERVVHASVFVDSLRLTGDVICLAERQDRLFNIFENGEVQLAVHHLDLENGFKFPPIGKSATPHKVTGLSNDLSAALRVAQTVNRSAADHRLIIADDSLYALGTVRGQFGSGYPEFGIREEDSKILLALVRAFPGDVEITTSGRHVHFRGDHFHLACGKVDTKEYRFSRYVNQSGEEKRVKVRSKALRDYFTAFAAFGNQVVIQIIGNSIRIGLPDKQSYCDIPIESGDCENTERVVLISSMSNVLPTLKSEFVDLKVHSSIVELWDQRSNYYLSVTGARE